MSAPPTPSPSPKRRRTLNAQPAPPLINGVPATRINPTLKVLAKLPFARIVILRSNRTLLSGPGRGRAINEEAWLGTQVGTLAARQCTHCAGGSGPFISCVAIDGFFKESCTNCHYGGLGGRCSSRFDYINAVAQALANDIPAPEIPGMAPANNFGGTIGSMGEFGEAFGSAVAVTDTPAERSVRPLLHPVVEIPVPHGGRGQKRIAPATVNGAGGIVGGLAPLVNYGSAFEGALAYARTLTYQGRRNEKLRLQRELAAIAQVEEELEGSEAEEGEAEEGEAEEGEAEEIDGVHVGPPGSC